MLHHEVGIGSSSDLYLGWK